MAMYRCICGEWVSTSVNHKCKPIPFNVIMTDKVRIGIKQHEETEE